MHLADVVGQLLALFLMPGFLLYGVWRASDRTRSAWLIRALSAAAYLGFIFVAGHWELVGYAVRYAVPFAFIGPAWVGARRVWARPWFETGPRSKTFAEFAGVAVLIALFGFSVSGLWYGEQPVRLQMPLRDGTYYVSHGGDFYLINHHNHDEVQRYALDILQLNAFGVRSTALHPTKLDDFVIFEAPVYSPCDGEVSRAVDGRRDQALGERDDYAPGNHVQIDCAGARVTLAHLRQGSVVVEVGRRVRAGERVGRVGNSGNSSEPHLHIHATREAEDERRGVPMLIAGRFPVRNTIFVD